MQIKKCRPTPVPLCGTQLGPSTGTSRGRGPMAAGAPPWRRRCRRTGSGGRAGPRGPAARRGSAPRSGTAPPALHGGRDGREGEGGLDRSGNRRGIVPPPKKIHPIVPHTPPGRPHLPPPQHHRSQQRARGDGSRVLLASRRCVPLFRASRPLATLPPGARTRGCKRTPSFALNGL